MGLWYTLDILIPRADGTSMATENFHGGKKSNI